MTCAASILLAAAIALQAMGALPSDDSKPVDRVADALAAGDAASAEGKTDAVLSAARRLDRLAARPVEGHEDIAARWRQQSLPSDAKDTLVPTRGRTLGPAYRGGQLAGGARIDIEQVFFGGEAAVVVVVPQSGRLLRVDVADTTLTKICGQIVAAPKTACRWLPIFTTRYKISVINPGKSSARYYLVSN